MTDQDKPRYREWTVSYKKGFGPWINRWPSDFEANEEERVRLVEYSALLEEQEKVKALGAQVAELKKQNEMLEIKYKTVKALSEIPNTIKERNLKSAVKVLRDAVELLNPNNLNHNTYTDVFDCISKPSPSCTEFDKWRFSKPFMEALSKVEALLGKK